ncbi:hypothetical protein [Nocardioides sp.]|uniref:hypothetical protein n=1 Tax=Nocardioides sp. TaxID=35761 RepID=UPI002617D5E0|nr:hypothetical protein [Nocardioides sp.]MDI6910020.1 hypothetical protein [Nocardioides sp.]
MTTLLTHDQAEALIERARGGDAPLASGLGQLATALAGHRAALAATPAPPPRPTLQAWLTPGPHAPVRVVGPPWWRRALHMVAGLGLGVQVAIGAGAAVAAGLGIGIAHHQNLLPGGGSEQQPTAPLDRSPASGAPSDESDATADPTAAPAGTPTPVVPAGAPSGASAGTPGQPGTGTSAGGTDDQGAEDQGDDSGQDDSGQEDPGQDEPGTDPGDDPSDHAGGPDDSPEPSEPAQEASDEPSQEPSETDGPGGPDEPDEPDASPDQAGRAASRLS